MDYNIVRICEKPKLREYAADWFHQKWKIPQKEYLKSMEECLKNIKPVPQWYVAMREDEIIGGLGVIENDFHDRKELSPNICSVYVEKKYRCQGIAGKMLEFACKDMKKRGIDTLYLVTEHTTFYERYGWEFLCMVHGDEEGEAIRLYAYRM